MKTLKSTQTWRVVLGLFLAFAMSGKMWAQSSNSRFVAVGAVHEYIEKDRVQARANAFIYEGKFEEYCKWQMQIRKERKKLEKSYKKRMKKTENEDVRDSLHEVYRCQHYDLSHQSSPYPKHDYVVIIRPSFEPIRGFAVEKDKVVYMDYAISKPSPSMNVSATEVSEDVCKALRSLMDNIVESARVTHDLDGRFDGTYYDIIVGAYPTHMVKSHGGRNNEEGAACRLLEKLSEAAKQKDAATINAQLEEIKRLDAFYSALKVK